MPIWQLVAARLVIERSLLCQVFDHRGGVAVECGLDNGF